MSARYLIARFVEELATGQIFVTRELLAFGLRSNVDCILSAMVGRGAIIRLARGVFVRNEGGLKLPSMQEIVDAKARAFGRKANKTPAKLAEENGLKPKPRRKVVNKKAPKPGINSEKIVAEYAVLGCTTSFSSCYGRIQFRHTPARKYFLSESDDGRALVAWWASESEEDVKGLLRKYMSKLKKVEKQQFRRIGAWAPQEISNLFIDASVRYDLQTPKSIYPLSA